MVLRGLSLKRMECGPEGRVLATTSLCIGEMVEERGEQANREMLAHGREEVRTGSPGRRPAVLQRHWRGSQDS